MTKLQHTKAKFLSEVGKQTEVFLQFSTIAGERGAADAERDVRGFAVKFYTEDINNSSILILLISHSTLSALFFHGSCGPFTEDYLNV